MSGAAFPLRRHLNLGRIARFREQRSIRQAQHLAAGGLEIGDFGHCCGTWNNLVDQPGESYRSVSKMRLRVVMSELHAISDPAHMDVRPTQMQCEPAPSRMTARAFFTRR